MTPPSEEWTRRAAEAEGDGVVSVGGLAARSGAIDDILAPVRRGFAESGMTDDELDALFRAARENVRRGRVADTRSNP